MAIQRPCSISRYYDAHRGFTGLFIFLTPIKNRRSAAFFKYKRDEKHIQSR